MARFASYMYNFEGLNKFLTNTYRYTAKDKTDFVYPKFLVRFFTRNEFLPILGSEVIRGGRSWQGDSKDLATEMRWSQSTLVKISLIIM